MKIRIAVILLSMPFVLIAQQSKLEKGKQIFEKGKYEESRDYFQEIVSSDNTNDQALFFLGRSEFFLLNFDEAEEDLKKAIEINNNNSDYYLWLGQVYMQKLQKSSFFEKGILSGKVLDNYRKAVKIDPENISARINLASYYINAPSIGGGSMKKAREQIVEIKKYSPEHAVIMMAQIYMQEEEYDLAIEEYNKYVELNPDDTDALYQLGMLYQGIKNYEEAGKTFERALTINPEAYSSLYQIGRNAIFWGENTERGIDCMKQYIDANPGSPNPGLDAAHWRLGMLYEIKGRKKLALKEYAKAEELNPAEEKYRSAIDALK